jgi:D-serine deaminase-like pyridoxal phosphate-dependent protein
MPDLYPELPTPTLLLDLDKLESNIHRLQDLCDRHKVELRPHIKTHKMVEVARRQLAAGAAGLTCAKIGEAEAMLPSGVKSIFIAHSLVDPNQAGRLRALADQLDTLYLACTSLAHAPALERVAAAIGRRMPVMMAVDTGLHREGTRSKEDAITLADAIRRSPHLDLQGLYTHEGHVGGVADTAGAIVAAHARLMEINAALGGLPKIWPGCTTSSREMAALPGVTAIRPGAYVLGDGPSVYLKHLLEWDQVALTILATVVDRPEPGLALIDAGSKVFSSDRTAANVFGMDRDQKWQVTRVNEEHGYILSENANLLAVGDRVHFMPAHVCTAVNLTDAVTVVQKGKVIGKWKVDARGRVN